MSIRDVYFMHIWHANNCAHNPIDFMEILIKLLDLAGERRIDCESSRAPGMKIATSGTSIRSVTHRIALVTRFLRDEQPDVLALQEIKVTDDLFPAEPIRKLRLMRPSGDCRPEGLSRRGGAFAPALCQDRGAGFLPRGPCTAYGRDPGQWRGAAHRLCVPAGGFSIPDPRRNEKFDHKLHFLRGMEKFFAARKAKKRDPVILVGDLNVAPLESDVWSHWQFAGRGEPHPGRDASCWARCRRPLNGPMRRAISFPPRKKSTAGGAIARATGKPRTGGRRLDHVWVSPGLADALRSQKIVKRMRAAGRKASDHVPVIVEMDV